MAATSHSRAHLQAQDSYLNGRVTLHRGDCRDALKDIPDCSLDACVTDPPYHLTSIVKRFGSANAVLAKAGKTGAYARASRGFMGKTWDGGDVAFRPELWAEVLRVLKPGAHLLSFGSTRTYHRMACAIEDAGFEIRDMNAWLYGSGFPKSHDVSKGIDKAAGAAREIMGQGPFASRRPRADHASQGLTFSDDAYVRPAGHKLTKAATDAARQWNGWGTAQKPALEPVLLGAKPLTVKQHVAILLGALTIEFLRLLCSTSPANDAEQHFSAILAKCEEAASSVLASAKTKSLESIGFAVSAADHSTSNLLASIDLIRTKDFAALSHVHPSSGKELGSGQPIPHGEVAAILTQLLAISTSVTTEDTSESIASSWASISEEILSQANRFTIETASKLTTVLRTLRFCLLPNISVGTGILSPSLEPICLARKPLSEGTVAANVLRWGTGALNVDGCRVEAAIGDYDHPGNDLPHSRKGAADWRMPMQQAKPNALGRWPANVVTDGSDEVVGAFPQSDGQRAAVGPQHGPKNSVNTYGDYGARESFKPRGDTGSAARFFYSAKADADDRIGSKHPTVKPVDLMRWLVRLVTPPDGTVLDPFAGTGTTGEAAWLEGFSAVLIEREGEYQADIGRRMALCLAGPEERARAIVKARHGDVAAGPLFAEVAE